MNIHFFDEKVEDFCKRYQVFILVFILVFSFVLRVLYLGYDSMWIDETISAIVAKSILLTGKPLLLSGEMYSRAFVFHYLMAFFLYVFRGDFGARFVSLVFGVLTVFLAYLFGKSFFKTSFSKLSFPFLICILSLEIIYSKQARFYQFFSFFYFLSVFLFYELLTKKTGNSYKKISYVLLFVISFLITVTTQVMGYILVPLFAFSYLVYNFEFDNLSRFFKNKLYIFVFFLGIVSCFYVFSKIQSLFTIDEFARISLYSNLYYSYLFSWVPIIVLSVIGLFIALKEDWKVHLSLVLFVVVPLVGLLAVKVFATRYAYFAVFLIIFYLCFIFEKIHFKFVILFLMLLFFSGSMFSFTGIKEPNYDFSMPLANYKGAYSFVKGNDSLSQMPIVNTWTPAAVWYLNKSDYWIKYSISGLNDNWIVSKKTGNEIFSNSKIVDDVNDFPDKFVLVLDNQGARKLSKSYLDFFSKDCNSLYKSYNIEVLECKI